MMLIRVDANARIGVGHAMRCLALAEAWIDSGGRVHVATAELPAAIVHLYTRLGARVDRVSTVHDEVELARSAGADFAVVDGYQLGREHHEALAEAGLTVLVIDDDGESASAAASVVLNQNPHAERSIYAGLPGVELLLGPRYALLRREFRGEGAEKETPAVAQRVLVSFGGADPLGLTGGVLDALAGVPDLELVALVGAANPAADALRARESRGLRVEVASSAVADRMRWADLAIVAAGSTCWELAHLGVPILAVVTADNQRPVGQAVADLGIGVLLGGPGEATPARIREDLVRLAGDHAARAAMRERGRRVIDGEGAHRVCRALREVRAKGGSA